MSNPNPSNVNAAAQAALAAAQAAKAKAQSAEADEAEESTPAEADEQLAKAWGFSVKRPKLSREAFIGLFAIVALLSLFGYVVARHLKNRSTVAESKVDPDVTPASTSDLLNKSPSAVGDELDDLELKAAKTKTSKAANDLEFDVGSGQREPDFDDSRVARKPVLTNDEDDELTFDEDTKGNNLRTQPKATASASDMPDFGNDEPVTKTTRVPATLELNIETDTDLDDAAPTKTSEPGRLKLAQRTPPADEDFEEPVRVGATNRAAPKEDFDTIPQRTTRITQKDQFADNTGFDDPATRTSPTTDLPPARPEPTVKKTAPAPKSSRHPLLRDGEYLVEEGDHFCAISKKLYGTEKYYLALAEHNRNRVADPCRMRPGLIIATPAKEVLEQQHATLIPKPKPTAEAKEEKPHAAKKVSAAPQPPGLFLDPQGAVWYRVGKGDTLEGIAQAHLNRASRAIQIANLNRERLPDPNKLRLGQELRLPNDASDLRVAENEKSPH